MAIQNAVQEPESSGVCAAWHFRCSNVPCVLKPFNLSLSLAGFLSC